MIDQDLIDRLESELKKTLDKVEIDRPFELEKLEIINMPECILKCIVKCEDDFLEENGILPQNMKKE